MWLTYKSKYTTDYVHILKMSIYKLTAIQCMYNMEYFCFKTINNVRKKWECRLLLSVGKHKIKTSDWQLSNPETKISYSPSSFLHSSMLVWNPSHCIRNLYALTMNGSLNLTKVGQEIDTQRQIVYHSTH